MPKLYKLSSQMTSIDNKNALFSVLSDLCWMDDLSEKQRSWDVLGHLFKLFAVLYDVFETLE